MPKDRINRLIECQYFKWRLVNRSGTWYADGRSNEPKLGRYSLGTSDEREACQVLLDFDRRIAVENQLADRSILIHNAETRLPLDEGRQMYEDYIKRPITMGGTTEKTQKRYRAVLDKFLAFCERRGVRYWNDVTDRVVTEYATFLEDEQDKKPKTLYLEVTTIKQAVKYLIDQNVLPQSSRLKLKVRKPRGTRTYCYTEEEATAILAYCAQDSALAWLHPVLVMLAYTGMRIGEAEQLRWRDIDWKKNMITVSDEASHLNPRNRRNAPTTKSHRSRQIPIHDKLGEALQALGKPVGTYVFRGPRGGRLKPDTVRRIFVRAILQPLAIRYKAEGKETGFLNGRLHSFRHFFCSTWAARGASPQMLKKWLGHRDSHMVDHYFHLHDTTAQEMMKSMSFEDDCALAASLAAQREPVGRTNTKGRTPAHNVA